MNGDGEIVLPFSLSLKKNDNKINSEINADSKIFFPGVIRFAVNNIKPELKCDDKIDISAIERNFPTFKRMNQYGIY